MAKKPKQSKKATTKNTSSKFTSFYSAMSTRKKLLYGTTVFTVLIATVLLLLLRNQFTDSGWYTSNWLYVAYTSLLLTLALILFAYKSLFKFSRLSILSVLLMIFIVSSLLSVDYYRYFLDLTSPVEITNTTDSYKEPTFNNVPQGQQVEQVQQETSPTSRQQTQSSPPSSANDEWYADFERRQKEADAKYAEMQRCDSANNVAGDTYSDAVDLARAAYDEVMAEWDAVKDLPYYQRHPYEQYAADAKSKHNAISSPAYTTYVNTVNSLKAQGCNITQTHSDYSW
jgi:hypothetical protein